jgi:ketosteroid isomerase-like protein
MRNFNLLVICIVALTACNNQSAPAVDTAKEQQALLAADKDFCTTEQQQGWAAAATKYYDQDAVGISPNMPVAVGKATILKNSADAKMDSMKTLSWNTEKAVVSSSGDLGYTWGHYEMKGKTKDGNDTTYYGAYATVWKKVDGSWKAVVDQNNDTPKP